MLTSEPLDGFLKFLVSPTPAKISEEINGSNSSQYSRRAESAAGNPHVLMGKIRKWFEVHKSYDMVSDEFLDKLYYVEEHRRAMIKAEDHRELVDDVIQGNTGKRPGPVPNSPEHSPT